jgi:hypothetical protein
MTEAGTLTETFTVTREQLAKASALGDKVMALSNRLIRAARELETIEDDLHDVCLDLIVLPVIHDEAASSAAWEAFRSEAGAGE